MKRAGIYFFYDGDGIVDRYNELLLADARTNIDYLLIVVNGKLTDEGKKKLDIYANNVLVRENVGFDVYAYKAGLEYIGFEEIKEYDEVILFNFTVFGPIYPFTEMFHEMEETSVDFWGITKHYGYDVDPYGKCKYGRIPEHIQSNFIVIRKRMLQSVQFKEYWDKMHKIQDYSDAICYHEAVFTKHFNDLGFVSDVYVQTDDIKDYTLYPLMMCPKFLIEERKCPIIKRKTFFNYYDEWLDVCNGEMGMELMEYLETEKLYDTDLIWENLLRTCNMYDMKQRMQLNYILPKHTLINKSEIDYSSQIALFMHIYFMDRIDYCKKYALNMPVGTDIYISTNSEEKKEQIEKAFSTLEGYQVKVIQVANRGRDVSALLVGMRPYVAKYKYICFIHDKKAMQSKPYSIGEGFAYHCFENNLASEDYVRNVIETFEKNKRLGMLVPPHPIHGPYINSLGNEWSENYENAKALAKKWNIKVNMVKEKPPVAPFGTCFWFRSDAMKDAFELPIEYNDFSKEPTGVNDGDIMHAIERLYPYFVQNRLYYVGTVMSDEYAKLEVTNLTKILRDYNEASFERFGVIPRKTILDCIRNKSRIGMKVIIRSFIGNGIYVKLWKIKERIRRHFPKT